MKLFDTEDIVPSIANIIGIIYNIPLMYNTIRRGTADDISLTFIILRAFTSCLWIFYSVDISNYQIMVSSIPSVISSIVIFYFKMRSCYRRRKSKKYVEMTELVISPTEENLKGFAEGVPKSPTNETFNIERSQSLDDLGVEHTDHTIEIRADSPTVN
jgi:uncharacterized protein with PQ loop repeat